ncbi:MAG: SDR family NAD(P)-dependent oxidoreductase [Reichenbachiella sp.]
MSKGNILITGVSTGIGYYSAKKFIEEGFTVYGSVRKQEDADRVSNELGDHYKPLVFDVLDHDKIQAAADQLKTTIGKEGLQCLINNSGVAISGPLEILDMASYKYQFDVNYFGLIAVTKAFLPLLGTQENCPHPPGKIINISSIAGKTCMPFMTPYSNSKAAVDSLTEGLRRELIIFGIDVIAMNPGPIETPIWEKAEEPNGAILESAYGKYMTNVSKFFLKSVKNAIKVETFVDKVYKNFKSKNPKTSEVIMFGKFSQYIVPKYLLSSRKYDKILRSILKV